MVQFGRIMADSGCHFSITSITIAIFSFSVLRFVHRIQLNSTKNFFVIDDGQHSDHWRHPFYIANTQLWWHYASHRSTPNNLAASSFFRFAWLHSFLFWTRYWIVTRIAVLFCSLLCILRASHFKYFFQLDDFCEHTTTTKILNNGEQIFSIYFVFTINLYLAVNSFSPKKKKRRIIIQWRNISLSRALLSWGVLLTLFFCVQYTQYTQCTHTPSKL